MALKYLHNDRRKAYRLAVVVSKKVNKSAVQRNRIRRRLYEAVRRYEAQINEPYDLVLTVFSEKLLDLSPAELDKLVQSGLRQAHITTTKD